MTIVFFSCNYNADYKTINHENKIQLSIPGWVSKEKLADDAMLSFANRYRNFYAIVIEGEKTISLDSAGNKAFHRIYPSLDSAKFSTDKKEVNGMSAVQYELEGKMGTEKEKIYYSLCILEGKKKYYQICLWTRGAERRKKYSDDFYKIIHSFKEI